MPEDQTTDSQAEEKEWEQRQWAANTAAEKMAPDQTAQAQAQARQAQTTQVRAVQAARLQAAQMQAYQQQVAANYQIMEQQDELAVLQKKERGLAKQATGWETQYLILLFISPVVDLIDLLEWTGIGLLISFPVNCLYSYRRWNVLEKANKDSKNTSEKWLRRGRTIIGGVGGVGLGGSFANTTTMFWEYMTKRAATAKINGELHGIRSQMKRLGR
jgi:pyruvate/2-oxoglutarate dehydrogenase complex dihydrolipoamide acyltransferase (E2) component